MSAEIQQCLHTMESLIQVFDRIERYITEEHLWDEDIINKMHLERQNLTAQLYKSLPTPTPVQLEDIMVKLHSKTQNLLAKIGMSQDETRDAVFKLQNYRKAKKVYKNVGG